MHVAAALDEASLREVIDYALERVVLQKQRKQNASLVHLVREEEPAVSFGGAFRIRGIRSALLAWAILSLLSLSGLLELLLAY